MPRREDLRKKMVYAALVHVPEIGWTEETLRRAAVDLDVSESMARRLFPEGISQAITLWSSLLDQKMLSRLKRLKTEKMRTRDKITKAVRIRLEELTPHKAAARATLKYLSAPQNVPLGSTLLFRTVDEIWNFAGDRSTDYNYYTKRGILSAVYSSTFVCWLNDKSEDHQKTWDFLERRIENALQLGGLPHQITECCKDIPHRVSEIFKALKP